MKLTPYLSAIFASVLFGISAEAGELTITRVTAESSTTNGEPESSNKTEVNIDYVSNTVDPTAGNFELICVDGKNEIRLTIPPWAFEGNPLNGWSIIDPNDPKAMGITLVVIDETGEHEDSPSSVDAQVDALFAQVQMNTDANTPQNTCISGNTSSDPSDILLLRVGDQSGVVNAADPGTSIREFEFLAASAPQSGFIELSDDSKSTRDTEGTRFDYEMQAQIMDGGVQIDPTQNGVETTWVVDDGLLKLAVPPGAFEKKFLSLDQKDFRYQVIDPDFPELMGINLIFEDVLGNQTELSPSSVDVRVTPGVEGIWRVKSTLLGNGAADDPYQMLHQPANALEILSGPYAGSWKATHLGTALQELEIRLEPQVPDGEICDNGIDDDGDDLIDNQDPDCTKDPL